MPHLGTSFDRQPEQADVASLSESENLTSPSLSDYDCDSEDEVVRNDFSSEESDGPVTGSHKLGVMNLKFQLNAVKAGEHHIMS